MTDWMMGAGGGDEMAPRQADVNAMRKKAVEALRDEGDDTPDTEIPAPELTVHEQQFSFPSWVPVSRDLVQLRLDNGDVLEGEISVRHFFSAQSQYILYVGNLNLFGHNGRRLSGTILMERPNNAWVLGGDMEKLVEVPIRVL